MLHISIVRIFNLIDYMDVKSRIKAFIKYKNIPTKQFEEKCGLSNGYISSMRSGFGTNKLEQVLNEFPELNRNWLLFGEGQMIKDKDAITEKVATNNHFTVVPLLPVSARGGSLDEFVTSVRTEDCEKIISPISGVDFAMPVVGDSMAPEYPNGSTVLIKRINERALVIWGQVYVLDTCNGSVIKKIMPGPDNDSVTCVSLNSEYPPFVVRFEDMIGMYRVMMFLALK